MSARLAERFLTIWSNQMDDFLDKVVPSAIAGERCQPGQPQSSPSRIFNWIKIAAALSACLFGLARLGSHIQRAPTVPSAEINLPAQKAAEESYAQKTEVETMRAAQSPKTEEVSAHETAKPGLEAAKDEAGPGIVEAPSQVGRLPAKPVEKLAKGGETPDRIGLKIAALLASDSVVDHSVSATPAPKRGQSARGDAFDPSQHPNAPGAPRPLGILRSTAPATKSSADYAYRQPAN
jgi:hypothetical protein